MPSIPLIRVHFALTSLTEEGTCPARQNESVLSKVAQIVLTCRASLHLRSTFGLSSVPSTRRILYRTGTDSTVHRPLSTSSSARSNSVSTTCETLQPTVSASALQPSAIVGGSTYVRLMRVTRCSIASLSWYNEDVLLSFRNFCRESRRPLRRGAGFGVL